MTMPRTRTHPGEILAEEFMKPHRLDTSALALALDVPGDRGGRLWAPAGNGDLAAELRHDRAIPELCGIM
jgi:hypothetical protein